MGNKSSKSLSPSTSNSFSALSSLPLQDHVSTRPTDDEILNFEQQIKAIHVDSIPIISDLLPIDVISSEYEFGALGFQQKILELQESYSWFRRCRGDGNCFYRAVGFGLVELIGTLPSALEPLRQRSIELLKAAKFEPLAYEDFTDEFFLMASQYTSLSTGASEWLAKEWREAEHRSNSAVVFLRMVTSAYLKLNAQDFEPFIMDSGCAGMEQFCNRFVESLGQESDQIHIIAVTKALGFDVSIAYLDAGEDHNLSNLHFGPDSSDQFHANFPSAISLLYRPGHYDILYPK